jgi:hypothetical protein
MRFSYMGGLIQFSHPVTEGYQLMQVGLIDVREDDNGFDVQPTARLRAMVDSGAELETLYPLLVELVICHRNRWMIFNPRHAEWRLSRAGMSRDGVEWLSAKLRGEASS